MKHAMQRGLLLAAFIFGLFFRLAAQSTQIIVFLNNGTEQTYNLTEADRLYFEDNTKLVIEQISTKGTVIIPLADIRKITCDETVGVSEASDATVFLAPNPAHNTFTLRNLEGKDNVSIYALDGRMVKSMEVTGGQPVDISNLPIGLYLVKTQSSTFKMIKL